MTRSRLLSVGFLTFAAACTAVAAPAGPDVMLQDITSTTNYGVVGGVRAYAYDSQTCNIGTVNLTWASGGTPGYAMNLFRLYNGRLQQIGLGNCKTACCAAAGSGCGTCNGQGGSVLGAGCKDVYSSGYNGGQSRLAPRSAFNGFTGSMTSYPGTTGDAIFRRMQVQQTDLVTSAAGFPGARYFAEGVYVATDEIDGSEATYNNATYRPVNIDQSTFNMTSTGTGRAGISAIFAWREHGLGLNTPDNSVNISTVDIPNEGRYHIASKVTPLGGGRYRYDYAIYNLSSDRSVGSVSVPVFSGVTTSNVGWSGVRYHSGEVYDNTAWTQTSGASGVTWASPATYAQNPNSNALRWGTMYNYWFEANTAPVTRQMTIGFFKPGTPAGMTINVPAPACRADFNADAATDLFDYLDFVSAFSTNAAGSDFNGDGNVTFFDYLDYVQAFSDGCN